MTVSNAVIIDVSPHMTVMLIAGFKQSWTDTVTVSKAVIVVVSPHMTHVYCRQYHKSCIISRGN